MAAENLVVVYRFVREDGGRQISPRYMWGTEEAIASLGCRVLPDTARKVHVKLLENGFYFEQTRSSFVPIDEPSPDPAQTRAPKRTRR